MPASTRCSEARRRFHREARSVARLRHPRVLEIYDFSGEGSAEAYIAAELLTGPTLKDWREQHQDVPAEIAACFVIEIATALEAAHEAGIIHRDVKPENVLLHEDRELRLTDFGIADMLDAQSMTATGQILGSPGHMAPEQIEGKDCDARTDLFSLGTVLYYLATGRLPFTGRNPHQVLKRIVDGEYADPLRVNPTIGGRMREIIVKSLERDPADRYQSAREMIEDLEAFIGEAGLDDAQGTLERYLGDPQAVGAELRAQIVEHLIDRGSRASDAGDVPAALDYFNRVLALDEGNERVLKLIERVGMDRRRRVLVLAGAGLTALGAVTALGAWALWPSPEDTDRRVIAPIGAAREDGGIDSGAARDSGARSDSGTPEDAAHADASARVALAQPDSGPRRAPPRNVRPRPSGPRHVRLMPNPLNVLVGIDGAQPEVFGSAFSCFRGCELPPGPHTFRVVPGPDIPYEERTVQVTIPPGDDEYPVSLTLPLERAPLFVRSASGATVALRHGSQVVFPPSGQTARANELLLIPMRRESDGFRMTVSAPGYAADERFITLRAGESRDIPVPLTPRAGQDPAPE